MARKKVTFTCPECGKDTPKEGLCEACSAALSDDAQTVNKAEAAKPEPRTFQVGRSLVKVKPNAVWWGTDITPPAWVFNQVFYLQYWHIATGKATIGNSPRENPNDSVGTLSIDYLELA